ncbi:MAG: FecR domain-containing protein [Pseudomonadota bacterium]|nr:FecR domain-containing protein [Pseudomonadota bacterium]
MKITPALRMYRLQSDTAAKQHGWWLVAFFISCLFALPTASASEWTYKVRKGENLWAITEANLTSLRWVQPLQRLNGVRDPYAVAPGTVLRIPLSWSRRQQAEADVRSLSGTVLLARNGAAPRALGLTDVLKAGDQLLSGSEGHVTIHYPDNSVSRLYPDSELMLESMEIVGARASFIAHIHLGKGRVESKVQPGSTIRRSDMKIGTPLGTTSVRGTHFRVGASAEGNAAWTSVMEGVVDVADNTGRHNVLLRAGDGSAINADTGSPQHRRLLAAPPLDEVPALYEALPLRVESSTVAGAEGYRAELARDQGFDYIVASSQSASPGLTFPDVPDGDYWLRMRATGPDHVEGLDAIKQVKIEARPEPPFLIQPQADAEVSAGDVEFRWAARDDAREYLIEIDHADADGKPLGAAPQPQSVKHNRTVIALAAETAPVAHVWRARVRTSDGKLGPFGPYAAFTVLPPGPTMETPTIDGRRITLSWGKQPFATRWNYQMARDAAFKDILKAATTDVPKADIDRPKPGRYHVRIAWVDGDGATGPWSTPQQFDVPRKPPYWLSMPLIWAVLWL